MAGLQISEKVLACRAYERALLAMLPMCPFENDAPGSPRAILGVTRAANWREIRTAYRRLILQAHPDHGGDPARFLRIQNAYCALVRMRRERRGE